MDKIKIVAGTGTSGSRFVIVDAETGALIDDAQGYGFKTVEKAAAFARNAGYVVIEQPQDFEQLTLF